MFNRRNLLFITILLNIFIGQDAAAILMKPRPLIYTDNSIDKAIYGGLDVEDVSAGMSQEVLNGAHATALVINSYNLNEVITNSLYSTRGFDFAADALVCKGEEKFLKQYGYGKCSSVLVGPRQVLTAAHCIQNAQLACDRKSFIFDARADLGANKRTQYFVKSQVYNCKKIVAYNQSRDKTFDYALIELDREVEGGRVPVKVSQTILGNGDDVYMIGHPNGFLSKLSTNGQVRFQDELFYNTNLDAFGGNSGGPVFDANSNELVGLLIRGNDDLEWDTERQCNKVVHCKSDECDGESVLKIGAIIDDIEKARNN